MTDGRGVRLFTDLNNIFKREPNIDEYDVIPVMEPKHNKSPLVVVDHKLGVELWCVSILYQHAYDKLFSWRDKNVGGKFIDPIAISNLCRGVLLVNPECYTAWNIRKECIESGTLNIEDDLKLGRLILRKHPKSPETFIHRRWLLQRYINQCLMSSNDSNHSNSSLESLSTVGVDGISVSFLPTNQNSSCNSFISIQLNTNIQRIITQEFAVCLHAAEHYPCNYHAWSHRIWLIQTAYNSSAQVLLTELQKTITWFAQHVSDHSGFHYRQFLLTSLINQSKTLFEKYHIDINDLITQEFDKTTDLIACFPGHEALWYHRKFLFYSLMKLTNEIKESSINDEDVKDNGGHLKRYRRESNKTKMIENEIAIVKTDIQQCSDKRQKQLAERYISWLEQMLKI